VGAGRRKRETDILVYRAGPFQINWTREKKFKSRKDSKLRMKLILFCAALITVGGVVRGQRKNEQKPAARQPSTASGKEILLKYCASCHGADGKGNGPAAFAMKTPPPDLTTLSKRYEGKFPAGYISALLQFGRSFTAHGSEDMPVWGSRFKKLDPVHDPTGQQHVDDVVAYIQSLQTK
jgi:mono/diheme cytochrome c family protein